MITIIENPYHMEIFTKSDACKIIISMCDNCPKFFDCSQEDTVYCNKLKKEIKEKYFLGL